MFISGMREGISIERTSKGTYPDTYRRKVSRGIFINRPHECPVCHKTFARKNSMTTHLLKHSREISFLCEEYPCSKKYTERGTLYKHYRKCHSDKFDARRSKDKLKTVTSYSNRSYMMTENSKAGS